MWRLLVVVLRARFGVKATNNIHGLHATHTNFAVSEWIEAAYKSFEVEYYVKFAVGKSGHVLLIVSCHLPENR